jgi:hypothetical protein
MPTTSHIPQKLTKGCRKSGGAPSFTRLWDPLIVCQYNSRLPFLQNPKPIGNRRSDMLALQRPLTENE